MEDHRTRARRGEAAARDLFAHGLRNGVIHLEVDSDDGHHVRVEGRPMIQFGSVNYLSLDRDPRVLTAAKEALDRHGVLLAASRTYMSSPLSREVEEGLSQMFGAHALLASSTTILHQGALPVLVDMDDAMVLDRQVHASVQAAALGLRARGVVARDVAHGDYAGVERAVTELAEKHARVWFFTDGIHSMYGNFALCDRIADLLERHPTLHVYVDDAHGLAWTGPRGVGHVLGATDLHRWNGRLVVTGSGEKGFGAGAGILVTATKAQRDAVFSFGGNFIFSGPVSSPVLGALHRSAQIVASDEGDALRARLLSRVDRFNQLAAEVGLPLGAPDRTPIRFVCVGDSTNVVHVARRVMMDGYLTSAAGFPATPLHLAGLRVSLNVRHTDDELAALVRSIRRNLLAVLDEQGQTLDEVIARFRSVSSFVPPAIHLTRS